jgi:UDP-N-acetylglucosamine--N-acetylmuramyl-(pentapeptide) pyrophosphoryl-undecaprenol N-acetylglucosamine transferase
VGFQRRLTRANASFVSKMWRARRAAIAEFRRLQPRVVVSVGGYASMPAVFAAWKLDVPLVVVSYDRFPGRASALAARRAAACAVAFPDSPLPRATVTGAPVRQSILDVDRERDREPARAALGLPAHRFTIVVIGGSQGSGVLNSAVGELLTRWAGDRALTILHLAGTRFIGDAPPAIDGAGGVYYQPVGYEARMASVYAAADLLIGRGGASTVHEVAVTGTPAILVPWSAAAEDHQTANVRWLSDRGGAVLVREHEIGTLSDVVAGLRRHPDQLAALAAHASELGHVHRSGALADLVESVALPG